MDVQTFLDKLISVGLPGVDVQLLDHEMSNDLKDRILAADSVRAFREILAEWNVERRAEGKGYLHD